MIKLRQFINKRSTIWIIYITAIGLFVLSFISNNALRMKVYEAVVRGHCDRFSDTLGEHCIMK